MHCPNCGIENPDTNQFCRECGTEFSRSCSQCGAEILLSDKLCGKCGNKLTPPSEPIQKDLSFEEKLEKIQRYLPKGLADKILAQKDKIEGERKQVTVMFCDMEGFTGLVEKLGPEEAYGIMDQVYEILIHRVHDYEGTVNEMTGDGIMALFGAPVALEDAPQRAIRSSLAIHREMARFNNRIKQEREGIPSLKMRIGINSGPVVVGTLGNDLRVEFKVVGNTVNLASRMEGLAEPGTSYVTEETFKLTEGFFRFEGLGEREVKGKEKLVNVYRVIAPSTRRTRFDVSAERGLTHFIGRKRELELLLDGFERSKSGRGQAFSIMAEAGVGKSRLLYEFRKAVANEDATFLEGKCLSYSRSVAYHPLIDILKANFDIREGDGDSEIKEKVKKQLKVLGADEASTLPYLLELLSVKDSGIDKIPMSPEGRKDRIMEALKRIVLKGSEIRPLIMAVEDFHWIDKSSEDSFKDLLDNITGAKVFLIFTYRPEFVHAWGGKSFHSQVNLNRLSNRETLAMASHLLGTEDMDGNVEQFILEKTEGVPFFIEEFIRSIKDLKIIEKKDNKYHMIKDIQDVTIPSTIQDVIMARVDSLPEGAKDVLQIGSVVEREFSYALIKRVTGLSEQALLSHLSALRDSELVYERGIFPKSTNIFKHALTRAVVYDSILTKRKKRLHEDIANAIERLYEDNIDEHYEILSEHYFQSEIYEKSAEYSKLVAKKAGKTGSLDQAIPYTRKTILSLEKLPRTDDMQKSIIDARTVLGLHLTEMNFFHEAKEAIKPVVDLALKLNYGKRISQIFSVMGTYEYCVEEDFDKAFEHLGEALELSRKTKDFYSLVSANYWSGYALSLNCEFEKASLRLEETINLYAQANRSVTVSVYKALLSYLVYYFQGKLNLAWETSHESIRIAEESGDILPKVFAFSSLGVSCYGKGLWDRARDYLLKGLRSNERINQFYWDVTCNQFLGDVNFQIREYQSAVNHYEDAIRLLENKNVMPGWLRLNRIALYRAKMMKKESDIDVDALCAFVRENRIRIHEGRMNRLIGEILININEQHIAEAENWIMKAIEADTRNEMMWFLGRDYALYAELFKRKGDQLKAKENMNRAIEILEECGADGWVEKYEKELSTL